MHVTGLRAVIVAAFAMLATAALAAAQPASDIFKGFRSSSKDPINIDAKALEIAEEGKQRISVFSGGVTVRRGDTTLRANTIKLFEDLAGTAPKKNQFSRIEAAGSVSVVSGTQTVTGNNAVFNTGANTIVLSGDVVLKQGTNRISGDRLVIDLNTGRARVEQSKGGGQIKGVFTPGTPLGGDPGG
jgi:lipopolysaccharide export system protein LptA